MKRYCLALLIAIAATYVFIPQQRVLSSSSKKSRREYVEGRMLVKLRSQGSAVSELDDVAGKVMPAGSAQTERLSYRDSGALYLMSLSDGISVEDSIVTAKMNPQVEYAEPDYFYHPADTQPNDPFFNFMWDMQNTGDNPIAICSSCGSGGNKAGADIGATRAWDITTGSDDIVVAITDTGIDLSHPDFTFKD